MAWMARVAGVVLEAFGDAAVQPGDLPGVGLDQVPQRLEAQRVGHGQLERVELSGAAGAEHVAARRQHPVLAHHGVHLQP